MDDRARLDHVAKRLAHLGAVHQQPAVRPDLFGDRQACGHQERGPVDGVETDDFFADEMQIGGPEAAPLVFGAADGAEVGG